MHQQQHLFTSEQPSDEPPWQYLPEFLGAEPANVALSALLCDVDWQAERIRLFGRTVVVPRLVSWQGDPGLNYRYSGRDHLASGWTETVALLRDRLSEAFGQRFNFVLLNRYRSGLDYMGWHADDESGLRGGIASISLGAERRFSAKPSASGSATHLVLGHGSALYMPAGFQSQYKHQLPKTRLRVGERVNLTFRWLDD